jgi:hypothetical protein
MLESDYPQNEATLNVVAMSMKIVLDHQLFVRYNKLGI